LTHVYDGKLVCNLGSAGASLDGDPRPSWVRAEHVPDGALEIYIRRVDYDFNLIHELIDHNFDYYGFEEPVTSKPTRSGFQLASIGKPICRWYKFERRKERSIPDFFIPNSGRCSVKSL
jgi:hypothetical protein